MQNRHYKNFKTVVYIPAQVAESFTPQKLAGDYDFIEKYIGLDKVYLETHRDRHDVSEEQIKWIKEFLEEKGVTVSGGITTTIHDFEGAKAGKRRIFETFCYTDPAMRDRLKAIAEHAAKLFDEVILDDFYFTNCTCESCIREKGDRDWVEFRKDLMEDVSRNLIVGPARAVNPKIRMVIKYPNWRESYHFTGYVPDKQDTIFDATYIGTETRSPAYADQHLPEYLSYSLVRLMENAWPGRNGGGWFDPYQCWCADRYLEQAYLTAFAGAGELMHFQWSDIVDNYFVGAMGMQLKKIDKLLEGIGKPVGIPAYIPHASSGENHLEMRLGMIGIPVEATPVWPIDSDRVFITESAAYDDDIIDRLVSFVEGGGDAIITSGFLRIKGDELRAAGLTESYVSDRKLTVTRYHVTGDDAGYIDHRTPILFPEIVHGNNASWSLLNGGDGDYHASLFLRSAYGRGRLYIMAVPDNYADLYRMPRSATDVYKRAMNPLLYASGSNFSMFTYDDGSLILYRYVKGDVRPAHVRLSSLNKTEGFKDAVSGELIPAVPVTIYEDFEKKTYYTADVILPPGVFRKYNAEP